MTGPEAMDPPPGDPGERSLGPTFWGGNETGQGKKCGIVEVDFRQLLWLKLIQSSAGKDHFCSSTFNMGFTATIS